MKTHAILSALLGMTIILSLTAAPVLAQTEQASDRPDGWDEYSHGNTTAPDYAMVFPQDAVNTITITVSPDHWQAMQDNMTELYGEFGANERGGGMGPGNFPAGGQRPPDAAAPAMGENPGGMGGGGMMDIGGGENPDWIPVDITFNGQTWTNVGFRPKGNSSLASAWGSGNWKLPFKLDFDEFEDDYPEIKNQRYYGFKQLSFSSNWSDSSLLREKVTADIFREAGVPSAQTAFYAVYVDYGNGPVYFGLYTAVEVIDDTVIQTQFDDDSGNVYKPEATLAEGTFDEDAFDKETNQKEADYSDILALFEALHADTRTTDPAAWRSNLEAVFDIDGFMRWLAVNVVVQNWDTYGQMAHNYYLYNDPTTGLLTWIPWDNNMALMDGMGGGMNRPEGGFPGGGGMGEQDGPHPGGGQMAGPGGDRPGGGGMGGGFGGGGLSLDLENVSDNWPLIRYLMDDPVYHKLYVTYVEETINGAFEPAKMTATYQTLHVLIAPYVVGEQGEQPGYTHLNSSEDFDTALTNLINHVNQRYLVAQEYVSSQLSSQ